MTECLVMVCVCAVFVTVKAETKVFGCFSLHSSVNWDPPNLIFEHIPSIPHQEVSNFMACRVHVLDTRGQCLYMGHELTRRAGDACLLCCHPSGQFSSSKWWGAFLSSADPPHFHTQKEGASQIESPPLETFLISPHTHIQYIPHEHTKINKIYSNLLVSCQLRT